MYRLRSPHPSEIAEGIFLTPFPLNGKAHISAIPLAVGIFKLPDKSKFESGICGTSWAPSPTEVFWGSGRTECSPTMYDAIVEHIDKSNFDLKLEFSGEFSYS